MTWLSEILQGYFRVPPTTGFSPYRTGATVHGLLSAGVAMLVAGGLVRLGVPLIPSLVAGFVAVLAGWGVGAALGILSHYGVVWVWLVALALVVGGAFALPLQAYLSLIYGMSTHVVTHTLLVVLGSLSDRKPPG